MIELCHKTDCTGCGACYNICPKGSISMEFDNEGFLCPKIEQESCIECGRCQKACPVLHPLSKHNRVEKPLAVVSLSDEVRQKSSSGGMFSLLASWILEHKGVVFGAAMDDNYNVYHCAAETETDLAILRGSKYAQSNTLLTFRDVKRHLNDGRYVLYTGTPCQIAGLYRFLGKTDMSRLYTADLVCHGVPSVKSFRLYISKLSEKLHVNKHEIADFRFRELEKWGVTPSFRFKGSKERHLLTPQENLYMRLFLTSRLHRKNCYHCIYATPERVGDITMADFWGIGEDKPFDYDVSSGCSLILLNSEKGEKLFSELSIKLYAEAREWSEALRYNTQLHSTSVCPKDRNEVFYYLQHYDYDKIYNYFFNTPYMRLKRRWEGVVKFLQIRNRIKKLARYVLPQSLIDILKK